MIFDVSTMTGRELLRLHASILEVLRDRKIVKTSNNPVADYAELLVCRALRLVGQANSNKGFDAEDTTTGERYEIKARRITAHNKPTRFSPLRDFDGHHFDFLVAVLFASDFSVYRAVRLPWSSVSLVSSHNTHVNGRIVFVSDDLWNAPGALDVTDQLRRVELID
jgi:hypothetical protein